MKKIFFGKIHADYITTDLALNRIISLAEGQAGGFVVTPNVDHIVLAEKNPALQAAYAAASLSLADGKPLIWMSRLAGHPLPEKISGSDVIRPLLRQAAAKGLGVYLLGAAPGVGTAAADILAKEIPGLKIAGVDAPPLGFDQDPAQEQMVLDRMLAAKPAIVLMALGAPKQELLMHKWHRKGLPQVMLGIGASLDFIACRVKRSPPWMSNCGLEWLYRLSQDPKRLAKRYLVQDMGIIPIFCRLLKTPADKRIFFTID